MPAATAPAAVISEAQHRAKLGRDNSVSPYRHNLLTVVFYGSSHLVAESTHENNINYFNILKEDFKNPTQHGESAARSMVLTIPGTLGCLLVDRRLLIRLQPLQRRKRVIGGILDLRKRLKHGV